MSSSGARKLLPPSCPAIFRYEMRRPPKPLPQFDFGHVAHKFVLGVGSDIEVVHADDWRTKAARDKRDEAHAAGKTPILNADYVTAMAMKQAVSAHPLAAALFDGGVPERSGYWIDPETGMRLRFRPDWLTELGGRHSGNYELQATTTSHRTISPRLQPISATTSSRRGISTGWRRWTSPTTQPSCSSHRRKSRPISSA